MKVKEAIELGKACGLETIKECIINIEIHSPSLFAYTKINEELNELYEDLKKNYPSDYKFIVELQYDI